MEQKRKLKKLDKPVLFLIFNRPDYTKEVFEAIRRAKPPRLYIAADGPRFDRKGDQLLCNEARSIANDISWPCDVSTLFRDENLGCRAAVSGAIDWFFDQEESGIILEDDCLPDQSFFFYCSDLLDRYADDSRINSIAGNNFQNTNTANGSSYYYSSYNHVWGWATWRRAWNQFDHNMLQWQKFRDNNGLHSISKDWSFLYYWENTLDAVASGKIDSWAYVWTFTAWLHNGLVCIPEINLVKNIGFGEQSTHTSNTNSWLANLEISEFKFPFRHPIEIERNVSADSVIAQRVYNINRLSMSLRFIRDLFGLKPFKSYIPFRKTS